MDATGWDRVRKLDVGWAIGQVEQEVGVRLLADGMCGGGEVGASYVRWEDGRRSVLKWRPGVSLAAYEQGPLTVVDALRARGYPAPGTELAVQAEGAVITVQELLPGSAIRSVDHHLLDQLLDLNALQADCLTDSPLEPVELFLQSDGPGFCLHEPLRRWSPRAAALDDWVRRSGPERLPGDDALHLDFHAGNLLVHDDGSLSGVIDWDGAGRGNRALDLVTLRFGLFRVDTEPGVTDRLDTILDDLPPDVLRACWAHQALRLVDWAIRHYPGDHVTEWLDFADQRIDR